MNETSLSKRGDIASNTALRVDFELYFEAVQNLYHKENNPDGTFPLNVAENKLGWEELREKIEALAKENRIPDWVSGYTSSHGAPNFRKATADFMTRYLTKCPIDPNRIGFSAGATSVIEMSTFILANPGDVAVFPAPCYPVYKQDIGNVPGVERYDLVTHHDLAEIANGPILNIAHLERAKKEIEGKGKRFQILVLTNPDNPTGGMFSYEQLLEFADWCLEKNIHLIVNEIYGLSLIDTQHPAIREDYKVDVPFHSFACIMDSKKSDYMHLWYALSKDFGVSGFRIGLVHSHNAKFIKAYENLNLSHTVSNFSQWIVQLLMEDTTFMDRYIPDIQARLTEAYVVVIQHLKELNIPYVPSRGSLFVWLDLSEFLSENTQQAEKEFWLELFRATGILLTPGEGFGHTKKGQFRVVYPYVSKESLEVAMQRFRNFVIKKRQAQLQPQKFQHEAPG